MAMLTKAWNTITAIWRAVLDITFFWWPHLYERVNTKQQTETLLQILDEAPNYEEWHAAAYQLDELVGNNDWRQAQASKDYDHRLIFAREKEHLAALQKGDLITLVRYLRCGVVRNLGNITTPKLYNRAYSGTKLLIEDYVLHAATAVNFVSDYDTSPGAEMTHQQKLETMHDARLSLGRTCLILQGGSVFGLCHLGVVKALHLKGLLPRIMVGTATGALMAALVGVHTEDELLDFLSGDGIDLSAFTDSSHRAADATSAAHTRHGWLSTLLRRARRFARDGYLLDVDVLEKCVRANVSDITFEEAYERTRRVLNITISELVDGMPTLLNYLTAPHVLIWSAALASNASDPTKSPVTLMCKTRDGRVEPWDLAVHAMKAAKKNSTKKKRTWKGGRDTPLYRVAEMFNVNHYIVSQARPYLAPFLSPTAHHSSSLRSSRESWTAFAMRMIAMEVHHQLSQADRLGLLPKGIRRLLIDETVPGASWTVVPKVNVKDFERLLRNPTREAVDYWILKGERSVWPAISALKIRCTVEIEIDRAYQFVRRRRPPNGEVELHAPAGQGNRQRRQQRTASLGAL
ncbi:triacylglycerol lipase [Recurvomyces mirabilis]|nr:triacylglycerol lipase [Recurvomyces mirabilis]